MYGWPLLVHYCHTCHYNTPISYSPDVWVEDHLCAHCGFKSPGADLAGQSAVEMNQSQHDELAEMFGRSMQLSQQREQEQVPVVEDVPVQQSEKQADPIHFISTHYTPTAHLRPSGASDIASEPSRSPPPPYNEALMPEAMAETLRQHSIDPASLLPNQAHLFLNGDHEQRLRLLELWRIAPPSYPLDEHLNGGTWMSTSMEREEALARIRYEQQQQQREQAEKMLGRQPNNLHLGLQTSQHFSNTSPHSPSTPISPIREAHEPAWPPAARMRAASIAMNSTSRPVTRHGEVEPYMMTGYASEEMSRSASDPVYAAAQGLWQAPSYAQALEDQYGMYAQMREFEGWEAHQQKPQEVGQVQVREEDYDMEL